MGRLPTSLHCALLAGIVTVSFWTVPVQTLVAQTIDEIQQQIAQGVAQVDALKNEIAKLQKELTATSQQKQTLQTAVKVLDLNIQKLTKSITLTSTQIQQKDKEIGRLSGGIATTTTNITSSRNKVGGTLRELDMHDREPLIFLLVTGSTLSDFFNEAAALESIRLDMQEKIVDLSNLKHTLQSSKDTAQKRRQELAALQSDLAEQKQGLAVARTAQNQMLTQTKNKESTYQELIAQKKIQEEQFEQELRRMEATLGLAVGVGDIPAARPSTLYWPLDSVRITQYFGNTAFATQNPQIYGGKGHNAIDMAASVGTPVRAALAGVVSAKGNTDEQRGCYSYGRWVLIRHANGLSTLYTHLSAVNVAVGATVGTRQTIALSGGQPGVFGSGYSTGPHLHFGVFATKGIKVDLFSKSTGCKQVTVPIADPTAYLNPLSYLPK